MKFFIFSFFVMMGVLHGASTIAKITNSKKDLSTTASDKKEASSYLDKIAKDIKTAEKDIEHLEKMIDTLAEDQEKTEQKYEESKVELASLEKDFLQISNDLEEKHKAFVSLLSEQFSIVFAMEQAHEPTQKSILSQEVYQAYKNHNDKVLTNLKSDISTLKAHKESKLVLRNKVKSEIQGIIKKRDLYAQKKLDKKKLLKQLSVDEEKYNRKLKIIVDKQNSLRSTLAKLNILHTQEVEDARKIAAARIEAMRLERERKRRIREEKALARLKARKAIKSAQTKEAKIAAKVYAEKAEKAQEKVYAKSEKVRQINSSYKTSSTYSYKGNKTISPIAGAHVIKKFGTYMDPVYQIKIFNESITLQAPTSNAKVLNILNGKVVFSGQSSMLGKVVVVSHSQKIHTVYAGLSKIAPTIHVGSKIKQGYVVGKVSQKLIFQATKDAKHINPLDLIKI